MKKLLQFPRCLGFAILHKKQKKILIASELDYLF